MTDQRIFTRIPFVETLNWFDMRGRLGTSTVLNVSRGGVRIESGIYLRPGPMVTLRFEDIAFDEEAIELQALIQWCVPDPKEKQRFHAGMSWVYGEQRTLPTVNEVFYSAIRQYAVSEHFTRDESTIA